MSGRAIRPNKHLKYVESDGVKGYFHRSDEKTMDTENDTLIRDVIGFANEETENVTPERWLGWGRRNCPDGPEEFNKSLGEAHKFARKCFLELSRNKALSRENSHQLNEYLVRVQERRVFSIEQGESVVWLAYVIPSATAYCAYVIAAVINAKQVDNIHQCRLSECRKIFWRPKRRGPRPEYCCTKHGNTGSKRVERGMMP